MHPKINQEHTFKYRDHEIAYKRDFGNNPHLVDGMMVDSGFVVVKDGCNACPGAGWFQTVRDAKLGIDCLIAAQGDNERFSTLYRTARRAQENAPAILVAALTASKSLDFDLDSSTIDVHQGVADAQKALQKAIAQYVDSLDPFHYPGEQPKQTLDSMVDLVDERRTRQTDSAPADPSRPRG